MVVQYLTEITHMLPTDKIWFHFYNFLPPQHSLYEWYYFLNRIWYYVNVALILPVMMACVNRFLHPEMNKKLWTDHLARAFLIFGAIFYSIQSVIKYYTEGTQSICLKAMYIHHFAAIFILASLFLNSYIPWWTCPLGFMHGICIALPQNLIVNVIYAASLIVFQIGIYRKPYSEMRFYNVLRYFVNFVWVFAFLLTVGDCSNYMELHPQRKLFEILRTFS